VLSYHLGLCEIRKFFLEDGALSRAPATPGLALSA